MKVSLAFWNPEPWHFLFTLPRKFFPLCSHRLCLLHSDFCIHVTSSEKSTLATLPQTYIHSLVHFLFSYIALLVFTAHISNCHYIVSSLFITDLLFLNVNSMGEGLGTIHRILLVPKYCSQWVLSNIYWKDDTTLEINSPSELLRLHHFWLKANI